MGRVLRYLPLIGASLCALLATVSVWIQRQVLDNDTWTETSSELLQRKVIRDTVASFLVDQLYLHVDVAHQLEGALPDPTKKLSGPIAGGLRTLAERQAGDALAQPAVQNLWEQANRTTHAELVDFLEGDSDALAADQGEVSLDLRVLVRRVGERVGLRDLDRKLPPRAAEIKIASSDELDTAQDAVVVLKGLAVTTTILALLLYGLHVGLAEGRRRQAVRQAGVSLIGVGIVILAMRQLGGRAVVDNLVTTASVEPAARETWSVATELLASQAKTLIVYGVLAIVGAFIAGPSRIATDMRRAVAPWADEPAIAYSGFTLLILAILLWAPTEATGRLFAALILIVVLAIGFEMLRRQIQREWPDAKDPDWSDVVGDIRDAFASLFTGARTAVAGIGDEGRVQDEHDRRLAQLERLGELKKSGVLTPREFTAEKKRILAASRNGGSAKRSAPRRAAASRS
jgi:Short C-terminal domain